ncbi:hypothetical protein CHS0354_013567 [Potamilus streckersoni]|uniref:Uncharacterized protein n=1 Tax=Potamilus streckersoni TaxID=2493646 RepID=A0AAE0VXG2_9BIVA|nr:hypothetical protein CHS0354_013567 [Potamilus streckersoni]
MSSTGLCGALSGVCTDDFRKRDGTLIQNVNGNCNTNGMLEPRAVMDEWRVWKNESLFDLTNEVKDNLKSWKTYVCACDNNTKGTVNTTIPCGGHTTHQCNFGKKVGTKTCQILNQRKRRSVTTIERFPLPQQRARRSVLSQLSEQINMTEEEAQTYCQNYMKNSPIFDLCTNVPSTRSEENINNCAMDILVSTIELTKTTVWSESARESMREQCLNEISRNNTFREEASATITEIAEKACPSMCSYRGRCINGTCICDSGYGAADCSLDLSQPPELFGLLDNGLCDEHHVECDQAFVYGEIFAEGENLTCRIVPFIISVNGNRKYETPFYVPAEHETLFEVICPVQQTRKSKNTFAIYTVAEDRFVIGYTISVSNDGQRYGRDFDLYMYNSECQHSQNGSEKFTFSLMDGYCYIDHKCVGNGQVHKENECLICDDKQLKFYWSARENHEACRNEPDTSPSPALTTIMPNRSSQPIAINLALIMLSVLILEIKTI